MTNWHTSRVVEFDDDDATSVQAARLAIKHLDFAFLQDKRIEIQQCECKWGWKRRCTRGMPPTGPFDGAMYRQLTAVDPYMDTPDDFVVEWSRARGVKLQDATSLLCKSPGGREPALARSECRVRSESECDRSARSECEIDRSVTIGPHRM